MRRLLPRIRCRCGSLAGDERGAAFVEFGFLVPILTLFVVAIVDLSQGISQRFTMQQAVNRSLERLLVRAPTAGANDTDVDYTPIRQEAATAAGVPLSQVTLTRYLMCDGTRASASTTACASDQDQARYISLTVSKNFTGSFYLRRSVPLTASASMRIQ